MYFRMSDILQGHAQLVALREGQRLFEARYAAVLSVFAGEKCRYAVWTGGRGGSLLLVISCGRRQRSYPLDSAGGVLLGQQVATPRQLARQITGLAALPGPGRKRTRLLVALLLLTAAYAWYALGG